ncbi:MAG: peptidylprolyl isomerase [Candidatus Micrarchaeota archaeon]
MQQVSKGDFIKLSFEGKANGAVFEKTSKPVLLELGARQVVPGFEEELLKTNVGEAKSLTLEPTKAFGERREDLIALVPLTQFKQSGVSPTPGQQVELDGRPCRVQSVNGGRVRVDFNHPLAGKSVEYSFKIEEKLSTPEDKLSVLCQEGLPGCGLKLEGGVVMITAPAAVRKDAKFLVAKLYVIERALQAGLCKKVVVTEEYDSVKK